MWRSPEVKKKKKKKTYPFHNDYRITPTRSLDRNLKPWGQKSKFSEHGRVTYQNKRKRRDIRWRAIDCTSLAFK